MTFVIYYQESRDADECIEGTETDTSVDKTPYCSTLTQSREVLWENRVECFDHPWREKNEILKTDIQTENMYIRKTGASTLRSGL